MVTFDCCSGTIQHQSAKIVSPVDASFKLELDDHQDVMPSSLMLLRWQEQAKGRNEKDPLLLLAQRWDEIGQLSRQQRLSVPPRQIGNPKGWLQHFGMSFMGIACPLVASQLVDMPRGSGRVPSMF